MPTIDANGISIYYERSGSGPPLLFCNGSGATLAASAMLIAPFAERCEVVCHDQRGLGRTEIPPTPYTMADYAADAIGVLDAIGWDRCRVAGISFGGMVAQEIAVTWPERVERLALLCTSPGGADNASFPLHQLASLTPEERQARFVRLLDTRFTPEYLEEHPGDRGLADMVAAGVGAEKTDEQRRGEEGQLEARSHHDVVDRLVNITCPTFVASGRFDGIAPVSNGEAIASRVTGSTMHEYEGGHAFVAQDPAAFPEILDFLTG